MTTNKNSNFVTLLRKKGFTQTRLADELGISIPSVNKWVTNKAKPTIDNVAKMSALLDMSIDELTAIFFE